MLHKTYLPLVLNQQPRLKDLFGDHGIKFGFCVHAQTFDHPIKGRLIKDHANFVTTGSQLNMKFIQPEQGVFYWDKVDQICESAHEIGIEVHGIPGSWAYPLNPDWLINGTWTNQQLADILEDHVGTLAAHYEGKFVSLNVANEAYIVGFDPCYAGVWSPLGDDYVRISFESAQNNCSYPILYNSFYPDPPDVEFDKALAMVDSGLADGIGIQFHLWTGAWEHTIANARGFLDRIRAAGGWCRFSEITVLAIDNDEWAQAVVYAAITKLAIEYKDIVRLFLVWGITDPAWRGNTVLFNKQGEPKQAYRAIVKELKK